MDLSITENTENFNDAAAFSTAHHDQMPSISPLATSQQEGTSNANASNDNEDAPTSSPPEAHADDTKPKPEELSWDLVEASVGKALRKLADSYAEKAREFEARKYLPVKFKYQLARYSSLAPPIDNEIHSSKSNRSSSFQMTQIRPVSGPRSPSSLTRPISSSLFSSSSLRLAPSAVPLDEIGTKRCPP